MRLLSLSYCIIISVICTVILAGCSSSTPQNPAAGPGAASPSNLLIFEVAIRPNGAGEFIEIYNPADLPISLDDVYLADYKTYYQVETGVAAGGLDFNMRFPEGTTIAAEDVLVIAVYNATQCYDTYGFYQDFDTDASDENEPAMSGSFGIGYNLLDSREMVVLYYWDGSSDLVQDIDYLGYGTSADLMDKTGVTIEGQSMKRTDFSKGSETLTSGNGMSGHDETSEDFTNTVTISDSPSPGTL